MSVSIVEGCNEGMNAASIDAYLKEKAHVTSDFKIEWDAFRFMLMDKMFAMRTCNKQGIPILTVKLSPQEGAYYREAYPELIVPGYYMNKVHWNSIFYEQAADELLKELIDKSYLCAIQALPKKMQKEWGNDL